MSENVQSKPVRSTHRIRRFFLYVALLLVAFLAGFVWMGLKFREADRQSSLSKMQNSLASAAIDARRGDFETARLAASDFFTSLRAETDKGVGSTLSQAQKDGAQPLFVQQDQTIEYSAEK